MRKINKIIIHCSATKPGHNVTVHDVRRWHIEKGWSDIGYHFFIERDGTIQFGRPVAQIGSHVKGHNKDSIGICVAGGLDYDGEPSGDYYTPEQWESLERLVRMCKAKHTRAATHGHNEFSDKECPCFDVQLWLRERNI